MFKYVKVNVTGGWNTVAVTDNPNAHVTEIQVRLSKKEDATTTELMPYTVVNDGVDAIFNIAADAISTQSDLVVDYLATWKNTTATGSIETVSCVGNKVSKIQPHISASITSKENYACSSNTFLKDTTIHPTAKITATASWGGSSNHYYKLYQVISVEDPLNPGSYITTNSFVASQNVTVPTSGTSTYTFTLPNGKPGTYYVEVYNGSDDIVAGCSVKTATVVINQPVDMLVEADVINTDNGTNSGAIKLKGIDGGNGADYAWQWFDGTTKLGNTGLGAANSEPESLDSIRTKQCQINLKHSIML